MLAMYIESEKYEAVKEADKNSNTMFKRGIINGADCSMLPSLIC